MPIPNSPYRYAASSAPPLMMQFERGRRANKSMTSASSPYPYPVNAGRPTQPFFVMRNPYATAEVQRLAALPGMFGHSRRAGFPAPAAPRSASGETWSQSIGRGLNDFALGGLRGGMDVVSSGAWGVDKLGSTTGLWNPHAQDAVDRGQSWLAAHEYHPNGWADFTGRIAGNIAATAPLAEVKLVQAIPLVRDAVLAKRAAVAAGEIVPNSTRIVAGVGHHGDKIVQGLLTGLAAAGGHLRDIRD